MNAFSQINAPVMQQPTECVGFSLKPSAQSKRFLELTFPKVTVDAFLSAVSQWPVQALEYKSFLRFQIGKILDGICGETLRPVLVNTLMDRGNGWSVGEAGRAERCLPGRRHGQVFNRRGAPARAF